MLLSCTRAPTACPYVHVAVQTVTKTELSPLSNVRLIVPSVTCHGIFASRVSDASRSVALTSYNTFVATTIPKRSHIALASTQGICHQRKELRQLTLMAMLRLRKLQRREIGMRLLLWRVVATSVVDEEGCKTCPKCLSTCCSRYCSSNMNYFAIDQLT